MCGCKSSIKNLDKKPLYIKVAVAVIRFYQLTFHAIFGLQCKFYPTCSQYTLEAIVRFGMMRGSYLGIKRILRCGPNSIGGVDLVPEKEEKSATTKP